jgi:hypothetical protein
VKQVFGFNCQYQKTLTSKMLLEVHMKKALFVSLTLSVLLSAVFANDIMLPGPQKHGMDISGQHKSIEPTRPDSCLYNFSIAPFTLIMSYYDYMIGAYNNLPVNVQPDTLYGGYFFTFHGRRTTGGQRRVFYVYCDDNGVVQNNNELTMFQHWEGYPTLAVDPVSGKPLYAWHTELQTANDPYDIEFTYDAFLSGASGLINDPIVIIDNPITVEPPYNTTDNEFLWPSMQIGPSPNAGMRRVYVLARNAVGHVGTSTYASENVWIVYADFNGDMLEQQVPLTWNHTSIPVLDTWNHANDNTYRRPNCSFTVGNDGRIYYVGYHTSSLITPAGDIVEPDLDAFICDNYGQGTWTRVRSSSEIPGWNPKTNFGTGPGWITQSDNLTPVPDDSLFFCVINSEHLNAVMDGTGKIHTAALWAPYWREGTLPTELSGYYLSDMHIVKDLVYDTDAQSFSIREIYPIAGTPTDNLMWMPWDNNGDGEEDEFDTVASSDTYGDPLSDSVWPFNYWDDTAHAGLMFFHYNNLKITKPNQQGMMAAVWQDSNRARLYNTYPSDYPEYSSFSGTPEIWIACSPDNGYTWSEPFSLNNVETPQFAGMKPMWTYPANQVKYVGTTAEGKEIGKLALMFYDDFSWGSYAIGDGPVGQNDGGNVKFMELQITFPLSSSNDNPVATPVITMLKQNYPNPFNPETTIKFEMPKSGKADLSIYNTKGQLVKTLVNGLVTKGEQKLTWKGTDNNGNTVASGLYFYKLNANGKVETRKMMLLK